MITSRQASSGRSIPSYRLARASTPPGAAANSSGAAANSSGSHTSMPPGTTSSTTRPRARPLGAIRTALPNRPSTPLVNAAMRSSSPRPVSRSRNTMNRRPVPWVSQFAGTGIRVILRRPNARSSSPPSPRVADMYTRCRAPPNAAWNRVGAINGRISSSRWLI
jgi:hypothetical protein